jgi:hypothetical protein
MTQRAITAWALAAILLAQALPAMFLQNDTMLGGAATMLGIAGTGLSLSQTHVDVEQVLLVACALGTVANLLFLSAVVMGFSNSSAYSASLGGLASGAALLSVACLFAGKAEFVPLPGCGLWLGAMLWLSIRSGLLRRRQLATVPGAE